MVETSAGQIAFMAAAGVLVITVLSTSLVSAENAQDLNTQTNADIDSRRIAQAIEVIDQKDQAEVQLYLAEQYAAVSIAEDVVTIETSEEEMTHRISLYSDIDGAEISGTDRICIVQDGGLEIRASCPHIDEAAFGGRS